MTVIGIENYVILIVRNLENREFLISHVYVWGCETCTCILPLILLQLIEL